MAHTVLLVDDHPVFRSGLRYLLEAEEDMQVVGEAGDGESALERIAELSPNIVVMDISMPGLNGIEATKRIAAEFPNTIVVALSIHAESQFVRQMLEAGAVGYILKETVPEELVKGIRCVMLGDGYLSPAITGVIVSQLRQYGGTAENQDTVSYNILETKFYLPPLPGNYVPRPRLEASLENSRQLPLQIVIAPAGYGKSALVSSWVRDHHWPKMWLSLDENDSDLRQFAVCFVHAVRKMFPDALPKTKRLLKAAVLPPQHVLAVNILNELNKLEQHFVLVLDDFHAIHEKSVHDLLTELLRHPSPFMHLVIVGRTDPFLPISTLRAQSLVTEIREKNLQFTDNETKEFLQCTLDQEISEPVAVVCNNKLEGWVTGLQLVSVAISTQEDLQHCLQESQTGSRYLQDYLFEEILQNEPEPIRHHMLYLSILNRFCAPLVETLCPYPKDGCETGCLGIINRMKNQNLFHVPLDSRGYWFRFQHVFRDFLQSQLEKEITPDEIAKLHVKAGTWLSENGYIEEAVSHLQAGGAAENAEKIAAQIGRVALPLLNGQSPYTDLEDPLTVREQEILVQLVEGKSNKEIGEKLYISIDTVKSHLKRIFQKLEVKSRLQAVAKASDLGLLKNK